MPVVITFPVFDGNLSFRGGDPAVLRAVLSVERTFFPVGPRPEYPQAFGDILYHIIDTLVAPVKILFYFI